MKMIVSIVFINFALSVVRLLLLSTMSIDLEHAPLLTCLPHLLDASYVPEVNLSCKLEASIEKLPLREKLHKATAEG